MPLTGNKDPKRYKTMDIKTALLAGGNRKRKATSPQPVDPKSLKLNNEVSDLGNDVEILEEACGITVTRQPALHDSTLGDCKENKDINATQPELPADRKEKALSPGKEESVPSMNKTSNNLSISDSPKSPHQVASDNDVELLSDMSKHSDTSSCDEQNTSVNVSLNTSGQSISDEEDKGNVPDNKLTNGQSEKDGEKTLKEGSKRVKRKMTPAEAQKKAEEREKQQKERLLKQQEKEQRKHKRLLEKEQRLKEKMLRKEREDFERKERERVKQEKKEQEEKERLQRQKEKEEKARMKQLLLEQKLEEKKKKEEMKLKRDEEMKKAEEEKLKAKLEKEQKEREKQERAKAAFVKFFVKSETNTSISPAQPTEKEGAFLPFQVSDDMTLAPVVHPAAQERFDKKQLDHHLEQQNCKELYLQILKSGSYKDVKQRRKNRKLETSEADVIIINKNAQAELGLCPKLLQFSENVRPPYWGTWRKKSKHIRPRNPLGQDDILDYSVDSDDEWDEGGPGESLSGTENEDESEDDYEVDNEFLVPHAYLSDEEEIKEDDDEECNDPEKQKAFLKLKLQEFESERKRKTTELKPTILGCYFLNEPAFRDNGLKMFLENFSAELLHESPIPTSFTVKNQQNDSSHNVAESPNNNSVKKKMLLTVPDEAFPQLIRLVHGNTKNKRILAEEFQKYWLKENEESKQKSTESLAIMETDPPKEASNVPSDSAQISLRRLNQTIREIASYGKPPDANFNKYCWWVHENIREKYGLLDAPVPNQWKYISQKESEPSAKVNSASIKDFLSSN